MDYEAQETRNMEEIQKPSKTPPKWNIAEHQQCVPGKHVVCGMDSTLMPIIQEAVPT